MTNGPVLIELEDQAAPEVADAAPVPEVHAPAPSGQAMQVAAQLAARKPSRLTRWFWALVGMFLSAAVSMAAWDFATGLVARNTYLGWAIMVIGGAALLLAVLIILKELAGLARLKRVDGLKARADAATQSHEMGQARDIVDALLRFYRGREDLAWGRDSLTKQRNEVLDADALMDLAERELMLPLDKAAQLEVEAAARQVAAVTALVPLALADVVAALTSNVRMIRRIAEIYAGRSGTLGNWRLTRAVMTHLVPTGEVAVGDELIVSVAGGSILANVSRRGGWGRGGVKTVRPSRLPATHETECFPRWMRR